MVGPREAHPLTVVSPAPATPRPAASVVALRDSADGPEVLLVRRHERSRDFAGASVYPGGLVDAADAEPELSPAGSGLVLADARTALGEDLADGDVRALWVASCRELFEEAGILLARDADGAPVRPQVVEALGSERVRLQDGSRRLGDLLGETGLVLALDGLVPFARWITPEAQPRRWDTRFFLVAAPASQRELADGTETSLALWSRPADALAAYRAGEHVLA
ncbi:MAG: hypothetical protein QOD06_2599, partial [Candidatus Binatota bacterium]|nr:hypothetical protein [Candidatus Binatota bacterium]